MPGKKIIADVCAADHESNDENASSSERRFITVFTVKYYSINDLRYETNEDNKSSCSSYLRQYERKE